MPEQPNTNPTPRREVVAFRPHSHGTEKVAARLVPEARVIHPSLLNCATCDSMNVSIWLFEGEQHAVTCNGCGVVRAIGPNGQREPIPTVPAAALALAGGASNG